MTAIQYSDYYGHVVKGIGVAQMKATLSQFLARVKRGEEIVVTEHGQPIAKLVPYRAKGPTAKWRSALAKEGIVELGRGRIPSNLRSPSPVSDPKGHLRKLTLTEREEGW